MTNPVREALALATAAHEGQVDKSGAPYIHHPLRVADYLIEESTDLYIAGLLHDVVEDTEITIAQIWGRFGAEVARLVDAVTRMSGEPSAAYYARIKAAGSDAVLLKRADIADNTDPDRLAALPVETRIRLTHKYAAALEALA